MAVGRMADDWQRAPRITEDFIVIFFISLPSPAIDHRRTAIDHRPFGHRTTEGCLYDYLKNASALYRQKNRLRVQLSPCPEHTGLANRWVLHP